MKFVKTVENQRMTGDNSVLRGHINAGVGGWVGSR